MADEAKGEALPKGRVVYLGTISLSGGREGELWDLEEFTESVPTVEALRAHASAFAKSRKSYDVGGIYAVGLSTKDGRIDQMQGVKAWSGQMRNDVISAIALIEKGREAAKAVERARAKAVKVGPTNGLLDEMARIVAAAPVGQQESLLQGLVVELRHRSREIWRKRR